MLLPQEALESRNTVVIGAHRHQVRVVEPFRDPLVVERPVDPQALLERADARRQRGQDPPLAPQLLPPWGRRGVEARQPVPGVPQQRDQLPVLGALLLEIPDAFRMAPVLEPAFQALVLHGHREGLIESGVVRHVEELVGELVEDHARQLVAPVAHHRAHHRIGKPAEGRVCGHALDDDVITAALQSGREGSGTLLIEVTAIGHATGDGEAPFLRLHRQCRCGNDVPDDIRTVDLDVGAVAVVVRQLQHA